MDVPAGMKLTDAFETPMFTPSTKAETGHDMNIDLTAAAAIVGNEVLEQAMALCLDLFAKASDRLAQHGLTLADTKFELGYVDGQLVVCDEVITPDSSRIWPSDQVVSGQTPPSFDKQPFRDWLSSLDWDRTPPPPTVPSDIIAITAGRYESAYERITGRSIATWFGLTAD
jgi:phosphoribosylaminoimidazole-succinocarboxamide synthase